MTKADFLQVLENYDKECYGSFKGKIFGRKEYYSRNEVERLLRALKQPEKSVSFITTKRNGAKKKITFYNRYGERKSFLVRKKREKKEGRDK